MDRKYKQRGYMDSDRERERSQPKAGPRKEQFGPKTPAMPGKREVLRCASCALILPVGIDLQGRCPKCGFELHSCKQCAFFDTAARFECTQPITARIPRKDFSREKFTRASRSTSRTWRPRAQTSSRVRVMISFSI